MDAAVDHCFVRHDAGACRTCYQIQKALDDDVDTVSFYQFSFINCFFFHTSHEQLFLLVFIIFQAQNINKLARKYWNRFADKNYFDSEGGFITIFVSFPLMVIELYILVFFFFLFFSLDFFLFVSLFLFLFLFSFFFFKKREMISNNAFYYVD